MRKHVALFLAMTREEGDFMIELVLFIFGGLFIFYDFLIIFLNPGTFLDNLTSFTHIWSVLGGYLIFTGVYRKKRGQPFWKCWKKWIQRMVCIVLGAGVLISVVSLFFICRPAVGNFEDEADYVILLGGGIDKDGNLPKSVKSRVEVAAEYLNLHKNTVCVVTGGTLKWLPFPEAPEIKRELEKRGIEGDRILVEDQSLDTIQNFQFSCKMLADYENVSEEEILHKKMMVVTSFFHLRRAERLAERMGFTNINGLPAKVGSVSVLHLYVREIGAYIKLNLRILLSGKPEKIR